MSHSIPEEATLRQAERPTQPPRLLHFSPCYQTRQQHAQRVRPRWRQVLMASLPLFLGAMLLLSGCGVEPVSGTYQCQQDALTGASVCAVTITNSSSASGVFTWTASSNPGGASFEPSSGTVAPGATENGIIVTIPAGICPLTLQFSDSSTVLSFKLSPDSGDCTPS